MFHFFRQLYFNHVASIKFGITTTIPFIRGCCHLFEDVECFEPTLGPGLGRHSDVEYRRGEPVEKSHPRLGENVVNIEQSHGDLGYVGHGKRYSARAAISPPWNRHFGCVDVSMLRVPCLWAPLGSSPLVIEESESLPFCSRPSSNSLGHTQHPRLQHELCFQASLLLYRGRGPRPVQSTRGRCASGQWRTLKRAPKYGASTMYCPQTMRVLCAGEYVLMYDRLENTAIVRTGV